MDIYNRIRLRHVQIRNHYGEHFYKHLKCWKYRHGNYETSDLGEGMSLVSQVIDDFWKPRFLMDNTNKYAFEFMDKDQFLVTVSTGDVDWESLKKLPDNAWRKAEILSFRFPSVIYDFQNGVAEVRWQLNPDCNYYADDDGFGMTPDNPIDIYGLIDRTGRGVVKFKSLNNRDEEITAMRQKAEELVNKRL